MICIKKIFVAACAVAAGLSLGSVVASAAVPSVVMADHQLLYTAPFNYGIAANARGDVFFADPFGAKVLNMLPAGGTTPVVLLTGLNGSPQSVAVDSNGNVYMPNTVDGKVVRIPFVNGAYPTGVAYSTAITTYCSPGLTTDCRLSPFGAVTNNSAKISSVAVDAAGNFYCVDITDTISNGAYARILKQTPSGVDSIVVDNLPATATGGIASDAAGNLSYADGASLYYIPAGSNTANLMNASSLSKPTGVVLDPYGNLIVADTGNSRVVAIPFENGALNFSDQYLLAPIYVKYNMGVNSQGTIYYNGNGSTSVNVMHTSVYGMPSLAVGSTSATTLIYSSFNATTTFSQYLTKGYGATIGYVVNSCVIGTTYTAGQSCAYLATIKPTVVGPVSGLIGMADPSGNFLSQFTLTTNGIGSAVAIDPGAAVAIGSGFTAPAGVAIDNAGNVFVADSTANVVYELVGGAGAPVALGTGLVKPSAVAVDATGNLYIADSGNARVVEIPVVGSTLATAQQKVIATGLAAPIALAAGPLDTLYIAQSGSLARYENRGYSTAALSALITTNFLSPRALAVDSSGNIYIADSTTGQIVEINSYSYAQQVIASGLTMPTGLALDAAGDLFAIDNGTSQTLRIPNIAGTLTYAQAISVGSFASPLSLGIDISGNLYVTDPSVPATYKVTRTTGVVNFGNISEGATSSAMSASLLSSGNQTLTLGTPLYTTSGDTTHFSVTTATTCTAAQTLAAGSNCNLTGTFAPTVKGTTSELLSVNASPTITTTPLNLTFTGYGTYQVGTALSVAPAQSGTLAYGQTATFTATLSPSSFNVANATGTVTFTINGIVQKPVTLSNNTASVTTTALTGGVNSISATYSGDINYSASTAPAIAVNVTLGSTTTTVTLSTSFVNPVSASPGSAVVLTALVTPSVVGVLGGTVNFVSGTTVLGSATLTATSSGAYQALLTITTIPVGAYNVSAVYLGNANYSGSSSTTLPLLIAPASIQLTSSSYNLTSTPQSPGSVTLSVASISGLDKAYVFFTCSGLPSYSSCLISPGYLTLFASPASAPIAAQQVGLTVQVNVTPPISLPPLSAVSRAGRISMFFACLLPLTLLIRRSSRWRRMTLFIMPLCLLFTALMLSSCNSTPASSTPTGTTPITVTATSTSATTSITLNLTVAN
ncbi:MAG: Ig-like domain repeat protein [Acidobacteriaceae bacterium]|nr:Ig-like domain repeat protein [Acidobacteriaceae bacterium]